MPRRLSIACLAALAGLTAACVSTSGGLLPEFDSWESRQAALESEDEWSFTGRIGVRAGEDGFNGNIQWRQDGTVFRARIGGPIGIGTIFINGDRRELTLTEQDGTVTELEDAEADLRDRYGWTIPVTSLRYWALGIPDPASASDIRFNEEGLASEISQRDWHVAIDRYADGGGQPMPRRVTALSGEIRVRLVIDDWAFR